MIRTLILLVSLTLTAQNAVAQIDPLLTELERTGMCHPAEKLAIRHVVAAQSGDVQEHHAEGYYYSKLATALPGDCRQAALLQRLTLWMLDTQTQTVLMAKAYSKAFRLDRKFGR